MQPSGIITLTTDFGLADPYVGILKGVIWGIFPLARIVDLTHQVRPQDILQGAFLLAGAVPYFPPATVHLAVVDPGVGTERAGIAMATPSALFVGPDNGLFTVVWEVLSPAEQAATRVVELTEPRYWRPQVSRTFHGRDVFAPVAAHLAAGVPLQALGRPRERIVLLEGTRPAVQTDGSLRGRIVQVDHFGNCVSNVTAVDLAALGGTIAIEVAGLRLEGLVGTYAEGRPGQPIALLGSDGRLEIAVPNASAADLLGLTVGDAVLVEPFR
jgi:S-adenosylmethionine hydrolase